MTPRTLVTGATRGLGLAICTRLADQGHDIVGIARRPDPAFPHPLHIVDIRDESALALALDLILEDGPVNHLVNNAGASAIEPLETLSFQTLRDLLEVNLRAAAQCAKICVSGMQALGSGRIVNIGSRAQRGRPGVSAYAAAKAGLEAMTVCWALEYAERRITSNLVAPGAIETEMFSRNNPPGTQRRRSLLEAIPMKRFGHPNEVAAAVAFLLSDDAAYITGQTLFVCGGWSVATI